MTPEDRLMMNEQDRKDLRAWLAEAFAFIGGFGILFLAILCFVKAFS
jgi:hypothetical protein